MYVIFLLYLCFYTCCENVIVLLLWKYSQNDYLFVQIYLLLYIKCKGAAFQVQKYVSLFPYSFTQETYINITHPTFHDLGIND